MGSNWFESKSQQNISYLHPSTSSAPPASADGTSCPSQLAPALLPPAPPLCCRATPPSSCHLVGPVQRSPQPSSLARQLCAAAAETGQRRAGGPPSPGRRRRRIARCSDPRGAFCRWEGLRRWRAAASWLDSGGLRRLQAQCSPPSSGAWRARAWRTPVGLWAESRVQGEPSLLGKKIRAKTKRETRSDFIPLSAAGLLTTLLVSARGLLATGRFAAFGLSAIFFCRFSLRARVRSSSF